MNEISESDNQKRTKWFAEAKFGLFIHFGLYAVFGDREGSDGPLSDVSEWVMLQEKLDIDKYLKASSKLTLNKFDAETWVKLAQKAGMKYIVYTSKHHDGFCMYDSKVTDFTVVKQCPSKRDPLAELAQACEKVNMPLGIYYSSIDWSHPDFPSEYIRDGFHSRTKKNKGNIKRYVQYMIDQLTELLTKYGKVALIWFDGRLANVSQHHLKGILQAERVIEIIHNLQPDCLINDRLEYGGDFATYENIITDGELDKINKKYQLFELCMKSNNHWGFVSTDDDYKTPKQILKELQRVNKIGGNLLLNVGPTPTGIFPSSAKKLLEQLSKIMN